MLCTAGDDARLKGRISAIDTATLVQRSTSNRSSMPRSEDHGAVDKVDERFDKVDERINDVNTHLTIKTTSSRERALVLERFDDFGKKDETNLAAHERLDKRLESGSRSGSRPPGCGHPRGDEVGRLTGPSQPTDLQPTPSMAAVNAEAEIPSACRGAITCSRNAHFLLFCSR